MATTLTGFNQPSFSDILSRVRGDIVSNVPGSDANLRNTFVNALAYAQAAVGYDLYGAINFAANQCCVATAVAPYLDGWGMVWGINRKVATPASGNITVLGITGYTVPSGTVFQRSDGVQFTVTSSTVIDSSGSATVPVSALLSGSVGNTALSSPLNLTASLTGVNASATVLLIAGGTDPELDGTTNTMQAYRGRIMDRIQQAPHGGDANDYVAWALSCPGVTRAWVYPQELGLGTVTVRFCMDETYTNGIPTETDITDVANFINTVRPVTAAVYVVSPIIQTVNIGITGLNAVNTAIAQSNIQLQLIDYFSTNAYPGCTLRWSDIVQAISTAVGVNYCELISVSFMQLSSPSSDIVCPTGYLPILGTIQYN